MEEEYIIETSETPVAKRKRSREPDPESWIKNQRKKLRCEYIRPITYRVHIY